MKRIFIIMLALVLALSSCSPTSTVQTGENASSESSQSESAAEWEDIYAKKIAHNRKKVYEMLENCDDILDTIPNPAKVDTIPTSKMSVPDGETLPDCVADWAYRYFSYMVTGNVYFDRTSQEAQVLRFLAAMRRVDDEIADIIEISAYPTVTEINTDETVMFLNVLFICTPYTMLTPENMTIFQLQMKTSPFFSVFIRKTANGLRIPMKSSMETITVMQTPAKIKHGDAFLKLTDTML